MCRSIFGGFRRLRKECAEDRPSVLKLLRVRLKPCDDLHEAMVLDQRPVVRGGVFGDSGLGEPLGQDSRRGCLAVLRLGGLRLGGLRRL